MKLTSQHKHKTQSAIWNSFSMDFVFRFSSSFFFHRSLQLYWFQQLNWESFSFKMWTSPNILCVFFCFFHKNGNYIAGMVCFNFWFSNTHNFHVCFESFFLLLLFHVHRLSRYNKFTNHILNPNIITFFSFRTNTHTHTHGSNVWKKQWNQFSFNGFRRHVCFSLNLIHVYFLTLHSCVLARPGN